MVSEINLHEDIEMICVFKNNAPLELDKHSHGDYLHSSEKRERKRNDGNVPNSDGNIMVNEHKPEDINMNSIVNNVSIEQPKYSFGDETITKQMSIEEISTCTDDEEEKCLSQKNVFIEKYNLLPQKAASPIVDQAVFLSIINDSEENGALMDASFCTPRAACVVIIITGLCVLAVIGVILH